MRRYFLAIKRNLSLGTCNECGECFADQVGALRSHLVEVHGYIREGAQVFRRKVCSFCDAPGLYMVGDRGLCAKHKHALDEKRENRRLRLDDKYSAIGREIEERRRASDRKEKFKCAQKKYK